MGKPTDWERYVSANNDSLGYGYEPEDAGTGDFVWEDICSLEALKNPVIDAQTIMFWTLQLQFMEMDIRNLLSMYVSLKDSVYTVNNHTKKMNEIMDNEARFWAGNKKVKPSEDDRLCLATHLALQLSGLA